MHKRISGALFDFCAFLTTLDEPVTLSAKHDAAVMVRLLERWAKKRGLELDDADVENWHRNVGIEALSEAVNDPTQ